MIKNAFSDIKFTVEDMIAEGDKVIWRWSIHGNHTGDFRGLPSTGKDFAFSDISILRLEGGKFAELWVEQAMVGLLEQIKG